HIRPTDVLVDLERTLTVGKPAQPGLSQRNAEEVGNLLRQLGVGAPCEDLQVAEPGRDQSVTAERSFHVRPDPKGRRAPAAPVPRARLSALVGAEGFEPSNTGSK